RDKLVTGVQTCALPIYLLGLPLVAKKLNPDLVVLDLGLGPDISTTIKRLKDNNPKLKIITITAFAKGTESVPGSDGFLDKMRLGERLLPLVKTLCQRT